MIPRMLRCSRSHCFRCQMSSLCSPSTAPPVPASGQKGRSPEFHVSTCMHFASVTCCVVGLPFQIFFNFLSLFNVFCFFWSVLASMSTFNRFHVCGHQALSWPFAFIHVAMPLHCTFFYTCCCSSHVLFRCSLPHN